MHLNDQLAESRIKAAQKRGEFDDLQGQGKPLVLDDDSAVPHELRVAYRVLKNSGYVPAEVAMVAKIKRVEDQLRQTDTPEQKIKLVVKLGLLKSQLSRKRL